ncbi:ABC transporter ATP-binding protein [Ruania zhangjianzhongii]|uniref:ABC transporter ATP-binding protein n=1 Tax=Ruania zhangjianzhongii TaxID=2603206 RepID=UPI001AEFC1FC|nr:ABC transporter ATP-binding protein [Ruania zhangjianzhongii]
MMLDVSGLHVGYATSRVLNGVDLQVAAGETVGLLGRNGMGKTTLVRALCRLEPPTITAGAVSLEGTDLLRLRTHEVSHHGIAMVPQGRRVFGSLTVEENLRIVRGASADEPWTPARVFSFFPRLAERARSFARTLSGGEAQMLAIGRALMLNPRLLIMDEPSEGLAPAVLDTIEDRLQELRTTGLSVLVAEQNVDLALALSDRVYILGEHGTVAWTGTANELDRSPELLGVHLGL